MVKNKDSSAGTAKETLIQLEETNLKPGDVIQLQSRPESGDVRYSVRLIGYMKGRSVLVTTPMVDGKYLFLTEGGAFIFRGFSGRSAFAFSTTIVKSLQTPYPYLHLTYPKEVRSLLVRKGARVAVNIICAITSCDGIPIQAAGAIINLSTGGALMTTKQSPGQIGQKLMVKFKAEVNGIEVLFDLNAIIRTINMDSEWREGLSFSLGLQFIDVSPENSIPLLALIYHELQGLSNNT